MNILVGTQFHYKRSFEILLLKVTINTNIKGFYTTPQNCC